LVYCITEAGTGFDGTGAQWLARARIGAERIGLLDRRGNHWQGKARKGVDWFIGSDGIGPEEKGKAGTGVDRIGLLDWPGGRWEWLSAAGQGAEWPGVEGNGSDWFIGLA
jgi:hypothetical protein